MGGNVASAASFFKPGSYDSLTRMGRLDRRRETMNISELTRGDFEEAVRPHTGQQGYHCREEDEACGSACIYLWQSGTGARWMEDHACGYEPSDPLTLAVVQALGRR